MVQHNYGKIVVFIVILLFVLIIFKIKSPSLFSISTLELQKNNVPYLSHNSLASESHLGDVLIKSNLINFVCKSEIATLNSEQREVFSGGKTEIQTVYIPSFRGIVQPPDPRPECWQTSLSWDNNPLFFQQGQKVKINQYVNVTFDGSGSFVTFDYELLSTEPRDNHGVISGPTERNYVTYYGVFKHPEDETRLFWFEVDNSFLSADWKNDTNILRLGSNDTTSIIITNDLINNLKGELLIKVHKQKTKEELIISVPLTLKKGTMGYPINLPKETLGGLITDVKISVDFFGVKMFSKSELQKTFNIIPNIYPEQSLQELLPSINQNNLTTIMQQSSSPNQQLSLTPQKLEQSVSSSFIVILILIFVSLIIIKKIKKNAI